jgi:hypothetical protein
LRSQSPTSESADRTRDGQPVWGYHFAKGLVRTPGDFGVKGDPPTHPELLDWLATNFMNEGWSIKKLHRRSCSAPRGSKVATAGRKQWRKTRRTG